jgi:hypothetical protein
MENTRKETRDEATAAAKWLNERGGDVRYDVADGVGGWRITFWRGLSRLMKSADFLDFAADLGFPRSFFDVAPLVDGGTYRMRKATERREKGARCVLRNEPAADGTPNWWAEWEEPDTYPKTFAPPEAWLRDLELVPEDEPLVLTAVIGASNV